MVYEYNQAFKKGINKFWMLLAATGFVAAVLLGAYSPVMASAATTFGFTQAEIDSEWQADRYFPTDGATSVSAFGHDNVARVGIDSSDTQPGTFQRTEGIKTTGVNNFGDSVQVDLYLDPAWENTAVRAGLWVVGDNGSGARDDWYGIIEFVNNETCPAVDCSNQSNIVDHEGFRVWDSSDGWTTLSTEFEYGTWVTLNIQLDTANELYRFSIDGEEVATGDGGSNYIREVFLNSYNYGLDTFPTLNNDSYAAHWGGVDNIAPIIDLVVANNESSVQGVIDLEATCDEDCDYVNFWWRAESASYSNTPGERNYHYVFDDGTNFEWQLNTLDAERWGGDDSYVMADGTYYFYAAGKDLAGNWARSSEMTVVVNNNPDETANCKKGGWGVFLNPEFRNQGDCVSWTVSETQRTHNPDAAKSNNKNR